MSNKQQNGRNSSVSNTESAVYRGADPRLRNASSSGDPHEVICRDFVWGICSKGALCKYRHELSFEVMKSILKFCHDYQNKSGCTRPGCTYLHVSNEEENLFLNTRQIPRILQERYVAMSANSSSNTYFNEIISQRAPPPPPPPIIPAVAATPSSLPAPLPTLLAPPPPPPPPTIATTPAQNTSPIFTAPPPVKATLVLQPTIGQPNVELPLFDASKPPPPLPSVTTTPRLAIKRPADSSSEAGPSKSLKEDVSKLEISPCENCVHRELRVHMYQKKEQKIECDMEYQTFKFQKKMELFENGRLMLKSAVSPDLFRILDDYIQSSAPQGGSQVCDVVSPFNQMSPIVTGSSSTLQRQFLRNLMEFTQNLVALGARPSVHGSGSEVTIQSFLEMIRNVTRKSDRHTEESGLNIDSEKSTSPASTSGYSNNANGNLRPLPTATTTSGTAIVPGGATKNVHPTIGATQTFSHIHTQSAPPRNIPRVTTAQTMQSATHQQPGTSSQGAMHQQNVLYDHNNLGNLQMQGTPQPQIAKHPSNIILSSRGVTPPQGVVNPQVTTRPQGVVRPLGVARPQGAVHSQSGIRSQAVAQPQGLSRQPLAQTQLVQQQQHVPQQQYELQPQLMQHQQHLQHPQAQHGLHPQTEAHPQYGMYPQNWGHLQHGIHTQNGAYVQHGMHPQNGTHPPNVTPTAVPPSAYVPYQASVPPPNRPQYFQYSSTANKTTNMSPLVRTVAPQPPAPRPTTTVAPLQNGCFKNSPLPHYYSGYP